MNKQEKSAKVIYEIEKLLTLAGIPENLGGFGVKETDLYGFNEFAEQARGALDFNPVKIDPDRVADLFVHIK